MTTRWSTTTIQRITHETNGSVVHRCACTATSPGKIWFFRLQKVTSTAACVLAMLRPQTGIAVFVDDVLRVMASGGYTANCARHVSNRVRYARAWILYCLLMSMHDVVFLHTNAILTRSMLLRFPNAHAGSRKGTLRDLRSLPATRARLCHSSAERWEMPRVRVDGTQASVA